MGGEKEINLKNWTVIDWENDSYESNEMIY
jgi:hypothetical protein